MSHNLAEGVRLSLVFLNGIAQVGELLFVVALLLAGPTNRNRRCRGEHLIEHGDPVFVPRVDVFLGSLATFLQQIEELSAFGLAVSAVDCVQEPDYHHLAKVKAVVLLVADVIEQELVQFAVRVPDSLPRRRLE